MHRYKTFNAAMPTTAGIADVATGTAIKTLLQVSTPSTRQIQLISWGFSMDDPPGADSIIELMDCNVGATVTAHAATGVMPLDPNAPASLVTLGTGNTGYNATAEGAITNVRTHDALALGFGSNENIPQYSYQWMPDERPIIAVSRFLRVRVTTPTTGVNMKCWIVWDE
jgi:hypothetical protein